MQYYFIIKRYNSLNSTVARLGYIFLLYQPFKKACPPRYLGLFLLENTPPAPTHHPTISYQTTHYLLKLIISSYCIQLIWTSIKYSLTTIFLDLYVHHALSYFPTIYLLPSYFFNYFFWNLFCRRRPRVANNFHCTPLYRYVHHIHGFNLCHRVPHKYPSSLPSFQIEPIFFFYITQH